MYKAPTGNITPYISGKLEAEKLGKEIDAKLKKKEDEASADPTSDE